jgi:mycothiol synthase
MSTSTEPAQLAPGLTHRRPTLQDAPQILALMVACDLAVLGESDSTLSELTADLAAPGVDNERGGRLVTGSDGAVVGWLWTRSDVDAGEVFLDLYSVDSDVLRWLMARGREYVAEVAGQWGREVTLAAGSYAHDEVYGGVLRDEGLEVVRSFWQMRRPLDASVTRVAELAPGVRIRLVDAADPADLAVVHRVHEESFVDHWNHTTRPFDAWYERFKDSAGLDFSQWWLAEVDGEPAGLLIGNNSHDEINQGYVDTLGVLRQYRGRGVAKSLLYHAFADSARRGRDRIGLGVDSESPTGATRLYEAVGMTVDKVVLAWQTTVSPS